MTVISVCPVWKKGVPSALEGLAHDAVSHEGCDDWMSGRTAFSSSTEVSASIAFRCSYGV